MSEIRLRTLVAAMGMVTLLAVPAFASNDGLVFRALGFYRGTQNISEDQISCEIPTVGSAIADGGHVMGLWNTFGFETFNYPDETNPFGNPCGGWLQLQNNMRSQGINLTRVVLRMKIPSANAFRQEVPTRRKWPLACRSLRKQVLFLGARMDPVDAPTSGGSGSGQPNSVFVQLFPMLSTQVVNCLRQVYAPLSTDLFSSLPVVFRAQAFGVTDAGEKIHTQKTRYTVTLRHVCGNGRVDNFEECDPETSFESCTQPDPNNPSGPDLIGTCLPPGNASECICVFPNQ